MAKAPVDRCRGLAIPRRARRPQRRTEEALQAERLSKRKEAANHKKEVLSELLSTQVPKDSVLMADEMESNTVNIANTACYVYLTTIYIIGSNI